MLSLAAVLSSAACASRGEGDTRRELLGEWSQELVVPLYAELQSTTDQLSEELSALCQQPSEAALEAARQAWIATRHPLKRAEVFAFGPYSRSEYDRIGPKMDSWPARDATVEELLASGDEITAASLAERGVWTRGSPVIGYLLYAGSPSTLEALGNARRCDYLVAAAVDLAARAEDIYTAWRPEGLDFAAEMSGAGRTGTAFSSLRDAFGEIVNRMGFTLENIRAEKIGGPMGETSGGTPIPERVESRFSQRSLADIEDNLMGLEWLYFGSSAGGGGAGSPGGPFRGLDAYVRERGVAFADPFRDGLEASRRALGAIDGPLSRAVVDQREEVALASDELGELQRLIQTDIIGALGLTLNFNDNDGD